MTGAQTAVLRGHALAAWRAGLRAVDATAAAERALARRTDLHPNASSTLVLAAGKAAVPMMRGALPVARAIVLAPAGVEAGDLPAHVPVLRGGHPFPTPEGIAATRRIMAEVGALGAGDLLVVLLSGGASALLEAPACGISEDDLIQTHRLLVGSGAPIQDINRIRICLSAVKGGGLARLAEPARVVTLALSDVAGDDPRIIGSGPTVAQECEAGAAWEIVRTRALELPETVTARLSSMASGAPAASREPATPQDAAQGRRIELPATDYEIVACAEDAARAACTELATLGYAVSRCNLGGATGEAADAIAARIRAMQRSARPSALVAAGETVVRLRRGTVGRGGRNLDLAARLALSIRGSGALACACAGTDGCDGSSRAAGAIIDEGTAARAARADLPLDRAVASYDTEPALAAAGDLLVTGATGTNVGDLLVAVCNAGASGSVSW
ncbi:MAG TPA: DUF4147 domain-containing protein [Candidatus Binatia bacterium]|nr:DUF4147 domain-containing protein [Candidatus Binatia bacterium]